MFAVEKKAFGCELCLAKTDARFVVIERRPSSREHYAYSIQVWVFNIPEFDFLQRLYGGDVFGNAANIGGSFACNPIGAIQQGNDHRMRPFYFSIKIDFNV